MNQKKLLTFCIAAVTAFSLFACKSIRNSQVQGLDVTASNIAANAQIDDSMVTEVKLLPNTMVPKGFLVTLNQVNQDFIRSLYSIIYNINKNDGLAGLEGLRQEITMVVAGPDIDLWNSLKADLLAKVSPGTTPQREELGPADVEKAGPNLPYIQWIGNVSDGDLWMQDWGEFAAIRVQGSTKRYYAVMDSGRGRGINSSALSTIFKIPFIKITGITTADPGNYGGNTEATPEGKLYYGDKLTDEDMKGRLARLGNQDAIKVPSDWLSVGHVDEFLSFIPARNDCGSSLVAASPLEGLNLLATLSGSDLRSYGLPFGDELRTALKQLLKNQSQPAPYTLDDFNTDVLSRHPSLGASAETTSAMVDAKNFVIGNLKDEKQIRIAVAKLQAASSCLKDIVTVPQVFNIGPQANGYKSVSTFGGSTNMLVLRDHLIIPEPFIDDRHPAVKVFRDTVQSKLAARVGADRIHFIDTTPYHTNDGEIHCGTNVVREIDMPFQFGD